jgi:hypothetical protein
VVIPTGLEKPTDEPPNGVRTPATSPDADRFQPAAAGMCAQQGACSRAHGDRHPALVALPFIAYFAIGPAGPIEQAPGVK